MNQPAVLSLERPTTDLRPGNRLSTVSSLNDHLPSTLQLYNNRIPNENDDCPVLHHEQGPANARLSTVVSPPIRLPVALSSEDRLPAIHPPIPHVTTCSNEGQIPNDERDGPIVVATQSNICTLRRQRRVDPIKSSRRRIFDSRSPAHAYGPPHTDHHNSKPDGGSPSPFHFKCLRDSRWFRGLLLFSLLTIISSIYLFIRFRM